LPEKVRLFPHALVGLDTVVLRVPPELACLNTAAAL
jgi:hypothetical protein